MFYYSSHEVSLFIVLKRTSIGVRKNIYHLHLNDQIYFDR